MTLYFEFVPLSWEVLYHCTFHKTDNFISFGPFKLRILHFKNRKLIHIGFRFHWNNYKYKDYKDMEKQQILI